MKNNQNIPSCEECIATDLIIFKDLTPEQLDDLNYDKGCSFYKRGNIIFQEDHRVNGFYCVHSGIIKMYKTGIDGKEQIIRFAKRGDIIGYRSILSNELACTTARVIEDATLCYIQGDTLISLIKENSAFSMSLMQLTCKELGEANAFIIDIAQKLLLKDSFGLDEDMVLQISLTREELANIVGTATESVIRLLSEFKQDSFIELQGRKIKIINVSGLQKIANF